MQEYKYCWQQVLLHWVSALVICWALVTGFYVAFFDVEQETADLVGSFNVSLTTLFIPIFLMRWLVRLVNAPPSPVHEHPAGQLIAHVVHEGLYWVTAVVLLSGVLMMDRPIDVFAWFALAPLLSDPFWLEAWFTLHIAACAVLALGVLLHVGAVILHELSGRCIVRRMLP